MREPSGNEDSEPSLDYLRELVLNAGVDYWDGPAGGMGLFRYERGSNASLILTFRDARFLVSYESFDTGEGVWVALPLGEGDPTERVLIYDGQETVPVHPRFLVPREMAWRAVEEFVRHQRPAADLRWEDDVDMDEPV